jgi:hypothetical protein
MKTITLTNDFHKTSVTLRTGNSGVLLASQVLLSRRTLCPVKSCKCGGALGERGEQTVKIDQVGNDAMRVLLRGKEADQKAL